MIQSDKICKFLMADHTWKQNAHCDRYGWMIACLYELAIVSGQRTPIHPCGGKNQSSCIKRTDTFIQFSGAVAVVWYKSWGCANLSWTGCVIRQWSKIMSWLISFLTDSTNLSQLYHRHSSVAILSDPFGQSTIPSPTLEANIISSPSPHEKTCLPTVRWLHADVVVSSVPSGQSQ